MKGMAVSKAVAVVWVDFGVSGLDFSLLDQLL